MEIKPKDSPIVDIKWYYRPIFVWTIIILFGPFAIPLVIFSPSFSNLAKAIISSILVIITIIPFYLIFLVFELS